MSQINNLNSSLFLPKLAHSPLLRKLSLGFTSITTIYFEFQLMQNVLFFFLNWVQRTIFLCDFVHVEYSHTSPTEKQMVSKILLIIWKSVWDEVGILGLPSPFLPLFPYLCYSSPNTFFTIGIFLASYRFLSVSCYFMPACLHILQ